MRADVGPQCHGNIKMRENGLDRERVFIEEGWGEGAGEKTPIVQRYRDAQYHKEGPGGVTVRSTGVAQRKSYARRIVTPRTGTNCASTERRLAFALTPTRSRAAANSARFSRRERGQEGALRRGATKPGRISCVKSLWLSSALCEAPAEFHGSKQSIQLGRSLALPD